MGSSERRKGADFEREIVRTAIALGLEARRTALNQTQDGADTFADVTIAGLRVECKHRKVIPYWSDLLTCALLRTTFKPAGSIAKWLDGHDALIVKQTGLAVPLVVPKNGEVITLKDWLGCLAKST